MSKPREPSLTGVKVGGNEKASSLTGVKVEGKKEGGNGKMSSGRDSEFVYVNPAYVGSVNDMNTVTDSRRTNRTSAAPAEPITEVYREQYWACSRWPYTQRVLAITVGVLLGALIGLMISLLLRDKDDNTVIGPIFTRQHIAPD